MNPQSQANSSHGATDQPPGGQNKFSQALSDLDPRKHSAAEIKEQARRYALPLALTGGAMLLLLGGGIALAVHQSRQSRIRRMAKKYGFTRFLDYLEDLR